MSNKVNTDELIAPEAYAVIKDFGFMARKGPDTSVSFTGREYVTIKGIRTNEIAGKIPVLCSSPELAWRMFSKSLETYLEDDSRGLDIYITFRTYPVLREITFDNTYTYWYVYSRFVTE